VSASNGLLAIEIDSVNSYETRRREEKTTLPIFELFLVLFLFLSLSFLSFFFWFPRIKTENDATITIIERTMFICFVRTKKPINLKYQLVEEKE